MAQPREGVATESRTDVTPQTPRMWRVLLHNDDFTTQDFVVWVLETVFAQASRRSHDIMLHVHHAGVGVAGVYTREVAETENHRPPNGWPSNTNSRSV